ncbi:hypothetical protein [Nocardia sp. NPDC005745]|uniref:hypothetical protein n=1 Tax=Nocardia sp. NPDC005745 TaxID=3157061 RepID=UPI0033DAD82B
MGGPQTVAIDKRRGRDERDRGPSMTTTALPACTDSSMVWSDRPVGARPGITTEESAELKRLRREHQN